MKGFVQETEKKLPEDRDFGHGKVYVVFRREAEIAFESNLYVRQYLAEFEERITKRFWKNDAKTKLYVTGPPGCGKTCFFYLWARLLSVQEQARVLIIQHRKTESCFVWIREPGGKLWRWEQSMDPQELETTVRSILNKTSLRPFDLCVHDGVMTSCESSSRLTAKLNSDVVNKKIRKVAHVTSLAFNLSTGGQRLDEKGAIVQETVDSWILDDYIEAIKSPAFVQRLTDSKSPILEKGKKLFANDYCDDLISDDEEPGMDFNREGEMTELVAAKHYYAGGSARFMFEFSVETLKELLDSKCGAVSNDQWEYFAQGNVASSTPWAVSTLMQQFKRKAMPVSKYILLKAYERCQSQLVESMAALAKDCGNPAIEGWAFELEQIDLIRLGFRSSSPVVDFVDYITNDQGLSFRPSEQVTFDGQKLKDDANVSQDGTVIWCQKWNQGCFDVAFFFNSVLVTLQFTVSSSHSLKPVYIRRLRDALLTKDPSLEPSRCVHIGVTPTGTLEFDVGPEGTGRRHEKTDTSEFTIKSYSSPPLKKKKDQFVGNQFMPTKNAVNDIAMWKLFGKRKRSCSERV